MARRKARPKSIKRSGLEDRVAADLDRQGDKYGYETHSYSYTLPVKGECLDCDGKNIVSTHWYTPDFFLSNGIIIEAKGYFKAVDRRKHISVREHHPDIDLRFVFYSDNKIHPKSETRYSDWAEKYGFKYAMKLVPEEWVKETK